MSPRALLRLFPCLVLALACAVAPTPEAQSFSHPYGRVIENDLRDHGKDARRESSRKNHFLTDDAIRWSRFAGASRSPLVARTADGGFRLAPAFPSVGFLPSRSVSVSLKPPVTFNFSPRSPPRFLHDNA